MAKEKKEQKSALKEETKTKQEKFVALAEVRVPSESAEANRYYAVGWQPHLFRPPVKI